MSSPDHLYRFVFEHANVRGEIVQLDDAYRAVLARREYPPLLQRVVGEALAAAALLTATLKFKGSLSLQVQGPGPLSLLLVQAGSDGTLRALARWQDELPEQADLASLCPGGYLAITIDPADDRERYQGIVALEAGGLAAALDRYFRESEQLATRVFLAADGARAAGLLIQRLPGEEVDADAWNRAEILAQTITAGELIELTAAQILQRLFHEEDIRLFDPTPFRFFCACSHERISDMLRSLGPQEVHDILAEQGQVEVTCDFCGQPYRFDAVDVERIFSEDGGPPVSPTRH
jgi:molecular chaperone Hsp33